MENNERHCEHIRQETTQQQALDVESRTETSHKLPRTKIRMLNECVQEVPSCLGVRLNLNRTIYKLLNKLNHETIRQNRSN